MKGVQLQWEAGVPWTKSDERLGCDAAMDLRQIVEESIPNANKA